MAGSVIVLVAGSELSKEIAILFDFGCTDVRKCTENGNSCRRRVFINAYSSPLASKQLLFASR